MPLILAFLDLGWLFGCRGFASGTAAFSLLLSMSEMLPHHVHVPRAKPRSSAPYSTGGPRTCTSVSGRNTAQALVSVLRSDGRFSKDWTLKLRRRIASPELISGKHVSFGRKICAVVTEFVVLLEEGSVT